MRMVKLSGFFVLGICVVLAASGCSSEQLKNLQSQNAAQADRINQLLAERAVDKRNIEELNRQLADARGLGGIKTTGLNEKIKLLEDDIRKKDELIKSMQEQLLGGVGLPPELSTMLEDFANKYDMVTYDSARGIVKFKSDLLFELGSDQVKSNAGAALKGLSGILNSGQGKEFDVIIAGHTDDIPIGRPATRAKHATNWHLSAHRAISVLELLSRDNIAPQRMSVRGFGQYRPVVPNEPGNKGNALNRRVEIYVVPKGT